MKKYTDYYCATVLATGNNNGVVLEENSEYVFKSYYKLRCDGKQTFRLFFINQVESTGNCRIGKKGDSFCIEKAYASLSYDKEKEENITPFTFDGKESKLVGLGERYYSDEFDFDYNKDGYMVLTFVVKTKNRVFLPATNESASTGRIIKNSGEIFSDSFTLRPCFIGVKRDFEKTVCFMGDSITQGSRIPHDSYNAWVHRIGNNTNENIAVWNIGMGWARAYDGAEDGVMVEKAAMCDEVFVCFGVNDLKSGGRNAREIINDLTKIKENILRRNENATVHFLTVPPFNLTEYEESQRKIVNEFIKGTDDYFDIAYALECDENGNVERRFMTNNDDAHPNSEGGRAIAEHFFNWQDGKND